MEESSKSSVITTISDIQIIEIPKIQDRRGNHQL